MRQTSKTRINKSGYRVFKDSGKSVHRWAAGKKLKRPIQPGEVVHHKDRNKLNNSPGNLYVFKDQSAHAKAHKKDGF